MRCIIRALPELLAFAFTANAAEVAGTWKTVDTNIEESTLTIKVDGNKIPGAFSSTRGAAPLAEGTIEENRISFRATGVTR